MNTTVKEYLKPAFLICVAVLAAAGVGMSTIKSYLDIKIIKKELPLKKSFNLMNEDALGPYIVREKHEIKNKDILESLGTEDYIQWILEDTSATGCLSFEII